MRTRGCAARIRRAASIPLTRRHAHVHEHDVGQQLGRLLDRLHPVARLADDREIGRGPQHRDQAVPEQRVVVDDQHANRRRFVADNVHRSCS